MFRVAKQFSFADFFWNSQKNKIRITAEINYECVWLTLCCLGSVFADRADRVVALTSNSRLRNLWNSQTCQHHRWYRSRNCFAILTMFRLGQCRQSRPCFLTGWTIPICEIVCNSQTCQNHYWHRSRTWLSSLILCRLGPCRQISWNFHTCQDHHLHKLKICLTAHTLFGLGFQRRCRSHFLRGRAIADGNVCGISNWRKSRICLNTFTVFVARLLQLWPNFFCAGSSEPC